MHSSPLTVLKKRHYTQLKKVGEGSFGQAHLVQSDDGTKLICKMIDVSQASHKEHQDAVKEGRLLAAFKHPYIVQYRDSFVDTGWLCILMAYCEGGDLTDQIELAKKRRQAIPEEQVLRWITQALLALKYIHDRHVLHRDLKSCNFFLSKGGNLKMGDFGIAKVLSCTVACAKTQIGTPYYLSPEVCQEKPYTWPSDIWAMGCILYELCALKVPFDAPSIAALVQKICCGPVPALPVGQYSDFTRCLCSEMLNRTPTLRPSAEAIIDRPRVKAIVRQMFEEAKAAQEKGETEGGGEAGAAGSSSPGSYRKGDLVEYYSNTHQNWLPATVVNVDGEGSVIIDLKNSWITVEQQRQQLRPRRQSVTAAEKGPPTGGMAAPAGGAGAPTSQAPPPQQQPGTVASAPQGAELDLAFEQLCAELELDRPAGGDGEADITVLDGQVEASPAVGIAASLPDQVGDVYLTDAELELLEKHAEGDGSCNLSDI